MFTGAMRGRGRYASKTQLPDSEEMEWIDWPLLKRRGLQHLITAYDLPVIEVDGEIADIIHVFVRINSTGKALTQQERRHARYYQSLFLKEAARLARRHERYFAVIAKGDEVLDWTEMAARHAGCRIKLLDGGDHALSDFDCHLPDIVDFLGLRATS